MYILYSNGRPFQVFQKLEHAKIVMKDLEKEQLDEINRGIVSSNRIVYELKEVMEVEDVVFSRCYGCNEILCEHTKSEDVLYCKGCVPERSSLT